ncbi:hypothetical protein [Curtobacterium sp. NPDC089185]|uniref:hypothetical protein n=1 Tax=Curtobacterium sp. NPDC089185 TaxID=3154968 RepID=UPI00341E1004
MSYFTAEPARFSLVAAATAAVVGSMLIAGPADAAEARITSEEAAAMRAAMTDAGISASAQDSLIAKLQSGRRADSERLEAHPVSVIESTLPDGGTSRVATFADGSQRTTSEVPITVSGADGPITTFTTFECNLLHCTALMSRAQTKTMATGSAAASAIIAALCGPAAWACAIGVGIMVDTANRAVNQGRCAGIRRLTTAAPIWPVIEPCRQ